MSFSLAVGSKDGKALVLNSWKEIASYVGRGVRTIQRYEQGQGFPVHRISGSAHSSVMAFPGEIDRWLHSAPRSEFRNPKQQACASVGSLKALILEGADLRTQARENRIAHRAAVSQLMSNIDSLRQSLNDGQQIRKRPSSLRG